MANPVSYAYDALPGGEFVRILTLKPAQNGVSLAGNIHVVDLSQRVVSTAYTAISYVWGSAARVAQIEIDGLPLRITASAKEVLCRVRAADVPTTVWIDGICINQDNVQERESQVAFMHKIYAMAAKTFVWLGPEADDSNLAMRFIGTLDWKKYDQELQHATREDLMNGYRRKSFLLDIVPADEDRKRFVEACGSLLKRAWFTRIWVQQEVGVSRYADVACGNLAASFDQIWSLVWLLSPSVTTDTSADWFHVEAYVDQRDMVEQMQAIRTANRTGDSALDEAGIRALPNGFEEVARNSFFDTTADISPGRQAFISIMGRLAWSAGASDPRDKMYAIRNMTQENTYDNSYIPRPDYTIAWQELYIKVTRGFIRHEVTRGSAIAISIMLHYAGLSNQDGSLHLPSWVPDWRDSSHYTSLRTSSGWNAGGDERCNFVAEQLSRKQRLALSRLLNSNGPDLCYKHPARAVALRIMVRLSDSVMNISGYEEDGLYGRRVDKATRASRFLAFDEDAMKFVSAYPDEHYVTGQTMEDAYAHVLVGGMGSGDRPVNHVSVLPQLLSCRQWLRDGAKGEPPAYMRWLEASRVFSQFKVCMTRRGLLCLVPRMCAVGDIIAVIRGIRRPVVLRPLPDRYYQLIGSCHVHGFMENQASLLVHEYKIKIKLDGTRSWKPEGDIRRNGMNNVAEMCHGEWIKDDRIMQISVAKYASLLSILGDQSVTLV